MPTPTSSDLPALLAAKGPPERFIAAVADLFQERVGWVLFTLTTCDLARGVLGRVYTSDPVQYPVSTEKPLTESDWSERVFRRGELFVGQTWQDYKPHYIDWEKLKALGFEAAVNFPVVVAGEAIGTVNLLAKSKDFYTAERVAAGKALLPWAALAFLLVGRARKAAP